MNEKRNNSGQSSSMALHDIYFVLFRHKWVIISLSALGFLAAASIYFVEPSTYQSEAVLVIKYVHQDAPDMPTAGGPQNRVLDNGSDGVIATEIAILNSFDLAYEVATNMGPAKVLSMPGGANDESAANAAANRIRESLVVDHVPRSSVMHIILSHPDVSLVKPMLQELITDYQTRHKLIHDVNLSLNDLMKEVNTLHDELQQTEDELRKAKTAANVNDIAEKKKSDEQNLAMVHQQIMIANAELAPHKARLAKIKPADKPATTNAVVTNAVAATTNADVAPVPKKLQDQYQETVDFIASLKKEYINLRSIYPLKNKLVQEKQAQLDEQEEVKRKMEEGEPRLAGTTKKSPTSIAAVSEPNTELSMQEEEAKVDAMESRIKVMQKYYDEVHTDSTNLDAQEFPIRELENKLKNQLINYDHYYTALQAKKVDLQVGGIADANIAVTQKPTPPSREKAKTPKMMGIAAAAGVLAGLAWAFLTELYFDHSVKRAKDIEGDLGMRLFLSIPDTRRNGHSRKNKKALKEIARTKGLPEAGPLVPTNGEAEAPAGGNGTANGNGKVQVAPWDHSHALHPYYEALRDRLISYFEVNNLNHKPKLVAVTGSSPGSGTSTIAAGLAASLSETGDGNVLLIDMNLEQGAAQQFFHGKPHCELDTALEGDTMEKAMIQDNLYVVAGRTNNGDKLSSMLPKRFANLIPRLKASDYDYIIFDMPPINRTGVTQRLAGFMDMMMLVVEAEKTNRDVVRQANALLTESKAKVSVVLNKTRTYIPARLHQEF